MQTYENNRYSSNSLHTITILQKVVLHGFLWEIEGGEGANTFVHLLYNYIYIQG